MALTEYTPPAVDIATASLNELATIANGAHERVEVSLGNLRDIFNGSCRVAMEAGDALLEAQKKVKGFQQWIADNLNFASATAHTYMRLATYREHVEQWMEDGGNGSIFAAYAAVAALPNRLSNRAFLRADSAEQAVKMRAQGMTVREIAEVLGASRDSVHLWTDPAYRKRRTASVRARRQKARAAAAALARQEQDRAIKKLGGKPDQAYTLLREKLCPLIDGMLGEESSPEARQALREALAAAHRCEDQIVRALRLARRID